MDKLVYESLYRYFNTLSKLGYVSYSEVDKLIVLLFIYDLLEDNCSNFLTEEDRKIINNALYCLYGSTCLIPYPNYIVNTSLSCSNK